MLPQVMTDWHFVVLVEDKLRAVNWVSGRVVQELGFKSPFARNMSGEHITDIGEVGGSTSQTYGGGGGAHHRHRGRGGGAHHGHM